MAACVSRQLPASTSGRVVDAVLLAFRQQRQSYSPTNLAGPQLKAFRKHAAARWQALEDRLALASNSLWTTGAGQVGIPDALSTGGRVIVAGIRTATTSAHRN